MTQRQIMTRAHEIARTLEGDYQARLVYGLRQAWQESRLIAAGGNRWEKATMNRIYFNDLATRLGLVVGHYNTGNISWAEFRGESISNSQARKIQGRVAYAKVWFDCLTGRFEAKDIQAEDLAYIIDTLTGTNTSAAKAA